MMTTAPTSQMILFTSAFLCVHSTGALYAPGGAASVRQRTYKPGACTG